MGIHGSASKQRVLRLQSELDDATTQLEFLLSEVAEDVLIARFEGILIHSRPCVLFLFLIH